jgi:hypothetical protein
MCMMSHKQTLTSLLLDLNDNDYETNNKLAFIFDGFNSSNNQDDSNCLITYKDLKLNLNLVIRKKNNFICL